MTRIGSRTSGTESQRRRATAYESALMSLLPSREQALLLCACLQEHDAAARAWREFAAAVGEPKAYFEMNQTGLKGLLPFVESSLAGKSIDAGKAFHTYSRVALVREELRGRIYSDILAAVLAELDGNGIPAILLKGGALSATVYPQPSTRHNHAIDLLVDAQQMSDAGAALAKAQFAAAPPDSGLVWHRNFKHSCGLALGLHSRPLYLPHFEMPLDEVRGRSVRIGSGSLTVLSPEDSLVHVCGHATYARSRWNLRWACDIFYLLERNPALNWSTVIDTAGRSRLALPMWVLLWWLRETLQAPIPAQRLEELRERGRALDSTAAEGIYAAVLHSTLSRGRALRAFGSSRLAQLGFLRFSALPSARYMRWRHNVDGGWTLAIRYADRPRRAVMRLADGGAPAGTSARAGAHTEESVRKGVA